MFKKFYSSNDDFMPANSALVYEGGDGDLTEIDQNVASNFDQGPTRDLINRLKNAKLK